MASLLIYLIPLLGAVVISFQREQYVVEKLRTNG